MTCQARFTSMRPRCFDRGMGVVLVDKLRRIITSMRPRCFDRGMSTVFLSSHAIFKTSMRPRCFDRGMSRFITGPVARVDTSMRPRCFDRGMWYLPSPRKSSKNGGVLRAVAFWAIQRIKHQYQLTLQIHEIP